MRRNGLKPRRRRLRKKRIVLSLRRNELKPRRSGVLSRRRLRKKSIVLRLKRRMLIKRKIEKSRLIRRLNFLKIFVSFLNKSLQKTEVTCWDCKTLNAAGYRFCDHCGAAPKTVQVGAEGEKNLLDAEKKKVDEGKKKADEGKKKVDEGKKKADEERKTEEEKKRIEAEKNKKAEEEKNRIEAERKRIDEEKKKVEEKKKSAEDERKKADEEKKRLEKKAEDESKKKKIEDEKNRSDEKKLDSEKKSAKASLRNVNQLAKLESSPLGSLFFGASASPLKQQLFVKFLREKMCSEVGLFLCDLSRWKEISDANTRAMEARRMASLYVSPAINDSNQFDSERDNVVLNLSATLVAEFERELVADASALSVFDLVEMECLHLCRSNGFDVAFMEKVEEKGGKTSL